VSDRGAPGVRLAGPRIVALLLIALGVVALVGAAGLEAGGYTAIGPAFFPTIVGIGLLGLGAVFLVRTTVRPDETLGRQAAREEAATHWPTVTVALAVLVIYAFALEALGYVVATVIFFVVMARVLGSRHTVRDAAIAVALSLLLYLGFTQVLGIRLPAGLLPL
jgi:putative tricarboxylic transport membrane protein